MKYFDLHCDTATECFEKRLGLYRNNLQLSIERGLNFEEWVQVYAIWMNDNLRGEVAYEHFCKVYSYLLLELQKNEAVMQLCTSGREINEALEKGKRVALLAVEGSAALGGKLEHIEDLYNKGIRFTTLTWNGRSEVADGCMQESAGGLTDFGKAVVSEMNRLGMIIDVSHLAEKGFWDVVSHSDQPFIATHSNSKKVCDHPRNLSDEAFKTIVERKGLVGMNFYPTFINGTTEASIKELLPHISHFLELGGENVIALGSDFDGATMPMDLPNIEKVECFYNELVKNYGKIISDKICFKNALNFANILNK